MATVDTLLSYFGHLSMFQDETIETEEKEVSNVIKFDPPLYIQRYMMVMDELRKDYDIIDQMVDFGCAELKFLRRARNYLSRFCPTFIGVDVDSDLLSTSAPYLQLKPDKPGDDERYKTEVLLYKGSVGQYDHRFRCADAVVAIELIEHLEEETLGSVPDVIFGQIQPYVAILTTPNVEFNVLFDMTGRRFRHWDHKFEWTRQEFQDWCRAIIKRYPMYNVTFGGVGRGPHGIEDKLGFCSQAAVFRWKDRNSYYDLKDKKLQEYKQWKLNVVEHQPIYELVAKMVDEPRFTSARMSRVLAHCQLYCLNKLEDEIATGGVGVWVTISELLHCSPFIQKLCKNEDTLMSVLINRDDYSWRFQLDGQGYQLYCEMEPMEEESEEEMETEYA